MQADMYNLVPAVGEINALRSNYSFAKIPGEKREFGSCDIEIEDGKVEPPPGVRGDIARIYMYMDWAYPGHGIISRKNKKLFEAWGAKNLWDVVRLGELIPFPKKLPSGNLHNRHVYCDFDLLLTSETVFEAARRTADRRQKHSHQTQ